MFPASQPLLTWFSAALYLSRWVALLNAVYNPFSILTYYADAWPPLSKITFCMF